MAKDAARTAKTEIQTLKSAAQEEAGAAIEEIKTAAQSAARETQEAGRDFITSKRKTLLRRSINTAEALRGASERLGSEEGNVLAGPTQKAADRLERMSGYLREKQFPDVLEDLESLCAT